MQKCVHFISKYLLFKMDEKAVRKKLPELIFLTDEPGRSNVVCFTDMAIIVLSEQ